MNLYELKSLEDRIDTIAENNLGEVPEALMEELVAEQCKSVQNIENLVKYIRNLELGVDMCDTEIERIKKMKDKSDKRISGIKKYLLPYVVSHGKVTTGTFTLTTKKSKSVNIIDEKQIPLAYMHKIPVQLKPDKDMIKKDITAGKTVPGAELKENNNLQIK
jgi:hypothetical protein